MLKKKYCQLTKIVVSLLVFFFIAKTPDLFAESYIVHASSYQNKENAIFDKVLLKKNNFSAFVKTVDLGSKGIWFRV